MNEIEVKPRDFENEYFSNYDPICKYNGQGREAISNLWYCYDLYIEPQAINLRKLCKP